MQRVQWWQRALVPVRCCMESCLNGMVCRGTVALREGRFVGGGGCCTELDGFGKAEGNGYSGSGMHSDSSRVGRRWESVCICWTG